MTARSLAARIRGSCPKAVFVVGGPHVSVLPRDAFPDFDYAVMGEGEIPFSRLVQCISSGNESEIGGIPGVVGHRADGSGISPPERVNDLDELPFPARDLLDMKQYFHSYPHKTRNGYFTTMFTSRGCSFKCKFCGCRLAFGDVKRAFSVQYVM